MQARLYFLFTRALPDFDDPQPELIYILTGADGEEGEEIDEAALGPPPEQLEYATTLVAKLEDFDAFASHVSDWWIASAGAPARIELIADHASLMAEDEIARLHDLEDGNWSFNPVFVAFRSEDPEARFEVTKFLLETSTVTS